jgi:hypothetical protein
LIIAYDNGTLACYDWYVDKVVDEWENFGLVKSMAFSGKVGVSNAKGIVVGFENGDFGVLGQ